MNGVQQIAKLNKNKTKKQQQQQQKLEQNKTN